jgi:glycosyltransferase involved in cell wall biosynthesis
MPKVTVIIPSYNAMTYLPETLDSVLHQSFTDFEVLIINDGSTDNVVEWAGTIRDSRVRLISQENQRLAAARNTGITHAKGEYLAFLDADDVWQPTKLEKQVNCLENNPKIGLVHTWTLLVNSESKPTGKILKSSVEGDAWQQIVQKNTIVVSSVMVRSSCLDVGVFDKDLHYCEDYDMWIRLACRYNFAVIKEPLTSYRIHSNTLSTHCEAVIKYFRILIERAFQSAPTELLYLRNHGYGNQNLYLAWRCLNNKDFKQAIHYQKQAIAHYPQLRYTKDCLRLSLAIAIMQWLKPDGYGRVLSLIYTLRRRILSTNT